MFHVEHQNTQETMGPHNLVTWLMPRDEYVPINQLWEIPAERALAENAVWWFLEGEHWGERDKLRLLAQYKRLGINMFIWKYYAAARCYLGGYKALAANLMLRRAL